MSRKGVYSTFGVPGTSEFTKPPGSYTNSVRLFLQKENQERASKFGSILGRDRGLVDNCSAMGARAPSWTGRTLNREFKVLIVSQTLSGMCLVTL